jgi:hypothetical protein
MQLDNGETRKFPVRKKNSIGNGTDTPATMKGLETSGH